MNKHLERIKTHFRENRNFYIGLGVGLAVGTTGVVIFSKLQTTGNISLPRFWSPGDNNIMTVFINPLGDPGNVIQCVETGTVYASQGQAARELGISKTSISNAVRNGDSVSGGQHFLFLAKAGQALAENA